MSSKKFFKMMPNIRIFLHSGNRLIEDKTKSVNSKLMRRLDLRLVNHLTVIFVIFKASIVAVFIYHLLKQNNNDVL